MARTTMASLQAEIAELKAMLASKPAAESEASQHYANRDIPCNATKPCAKTFRTIKGRDWHVTNIHAAK